MNQGIAAAVAAAGLTADRVELVSPKAKKPVWLIQAGNQRFYLKRMLTSEARLRFITAAGAHLRAQGVHLPEFVTWPNGLPFWPADEGFYLLMPAVDGSLPDERKHLSLIMRSLGRWHAAGRGFQPPAESVERSLLGQWPAHAAKKRAELTRFRALAAEDGDAFSRLFLRHAEEFSRQLSAAEQLWAAGYDTWVARVQVEGCICHQDYAASNLVLVDGAIWVLDVDSLVVDLPVRDLRKILNKAMKKGTWDVRLAWQMLQWYQETYPLTPAELRVLAADVQFPHLFCGVVNKYFTGRTEGKDEAEMVAKLEAIIRTERSKLAAVRLLAGG